MRRLAAALHLAVAACNPPLGSDSSDAGATTASATSEGPDPAPIPCDDDEDRWALSGKYWKVAAGDVDQDSNDDLVLSDGTPELIIGAAPGIVVLTLKLSS